MAFFNASDQDGFGADQKPLAEINVTPMVDVMLVLLVIFMVAAPLMTGSVQVDLPKGTKAYTRVKKMPLILSFDRDKNLYVGSDKTTRQALVEVLKKKEKGYVR